LSNASDFLENKFVDHQFRSATWAKPTANWIALYIWNPTDPIDPYDLSGWVEVTGGSYARVNLPPSDTNWVGTHGTTTGVSSGTSGQTSNAVDVQFPAPTADWGVVGYFRIMDASSGGNMIGWGVLTTPTEVLNGSPAIRFDVGSLIVRIA
jgi:hypothetical protein